MSDKLEDYLEEISHYLALGPGREEILSEIRSHLLEKAADAGGRDDKTVLEKVIADFGPPRKVAERYLEGQAIIAPAYRRHLFRYTSLLFGFHFIFTVMSLVFQESFLLFPFLFVPKMGIFEALMYLPTAFLTDLGLVALILYLITRSKKDIKLPWPRFAVDLDEFKPVRKNELVGRIASFGGAFLMLALAVYLSRLFAKYGTIFFANLDFPDFRPLLTNEASRYLSPVVIAMVGITGLTFLAKAITRSRWVEVCSGVISLALFGLILRQPFDNLFAVSIAERHLPKIKFSIKFTLLFIAVLITADLIKNLVILGKRKMAAERAAQRPG